MGVLTFRAKPEAAGRPEPGSPGTDARIIELSRAEPARFAELYERHGRMILRYTRARIGADAAEDVTAETFLAAFRQRAGYDTARASARPWLYGIAIRQIGVHRRAEARQLRALAAAPAEADAGDFEGRSDERLTAQRLRPRLAEALMALPRRDRELVLLIAWAELSYEDAAQALNVPVSTVKSRLHRARRKLQAGLAGLADFDDVAGEL